MHVYAGNSLSLQFHSWPLESSVYQRRATTKENKDIKCAFFSLTGISITEREEVYTNNQMLC